MSACPTFRDVPFRLALRGNTQKSTNDKVSPNIQGCVTGSADPGNPNRPEYTFCQHLGSKGLHGFTNPEKGACHQFNSTDDYL